MKIKSILLFLSILSLQAFATNGEMYALKCDICSNPGHIKRCYINHKDVLEIYTNGYRRVYDLQKKENHNIFASEDAANGMYYVTIRLDKDERSVTVVTPLATYIDSNCQRIK